MKLEKICKIGRQYGLDDAKVQPLAGGHANSSFLLETPTNKAVLTIFNNETRANVKRLAQTLQWLTNHGFPTSRLLPTKKGKLVIKKNNKPILVKQYIAGDIAPTLTEDMLRQLGEEIGRLHQLPPPDFLRQHHAYINLLPIIAKNTVEPMLGKWLLNEIHQIEAKTPANLPKSFIHGDIFWDNVLFKQQRFCAIIDFERAYFGASLYDIGMAIVGTCAQASQLLANKIKALLTGYETVRKLLDIEKQTLPQMVRYCALLTCCWRFWKYHLDDTDKKNAAEHRIMLDIAHSAQQISI